MSALYRNETGSYAGKINQRLSYFEDLLCLNTEEVDEDCDDNNSLDLTVEEDTCIENSEPEIIPCNNSLVQILERLGCVNLTVCSFISFLFIYFIIILFFYLFFLG
jgi:hypothetical protein